MCIPISSYVCKSLFLHSYTFLTCSCKKCNLILTHRVIYNYYFSNLLAKTFPSEFIEDILHSLFRKIYLSIHICAAVYAHSHMFEYTCMSMYAWIHMHMYMWPLEDDNRYLPHSSSVFCVEAGFHADPGAHRFV